MEKLWHWWLLADEPVGTVLGFVIVWCLIRQNLWAWPLGVAYVLVSVTVLLEARLYANLALHVLAFLPMNLYGWYYWLFGSSSTDEPVPVSRSSRPLLITMVTGVALGTLILGGAFAAFTDAAWPFWDNGVFVASLLAMWLTARKKIENWIFWFVIDVVSVGLYWMQGLPLYAGLYFIYLGMAVAGWYSWRRSMDGEPANPDRTAAVTAAARQER